MARTSSLEEMAEIYTRSFDLNPDCVLEIGWHLFGESYKRGQFLAMMRHHLQENDIDAGNDLPDYLPNLLDLTMKLETQDAIDLVDDCILPAMEKIQSGMKDGAYAHLLQGLFLIFTAHRMATSSGGTARARRPSASPGTPRPARAKPRPAVTGRGEPCLINSSGSDFPTSLALAVVVSILRFTWKPFSYSSLSSQFLENKQLFWGSGLWHWGILWVLTGHLVAFLIPRQILAWNSAPFRLYCQKSPV
ncbi:MAG: respiratory nitrate reductase subunit gamma [Holophagaceae bacterium]|nr:respiratory nitrate reductase subunit gamma [Holophagaceae bacterium]